MDTSARQSGSVETTLEGFWEAFSRTMERNEPNLAARLREDVEELEAVLGEERQLSIRAFIQEELHEDFSSVPNLKDRAIRFLAGSKFFACKEEAAEVFRLNLEAWEDLPFAKDLEGRKAYALRIGILFDAVRTFLAQSSGHPVAPAINLLPKHELFLLHLHETNFALYQAFLDARSEGHVYPEGGFFNFVPGVVAVARWFGDYGFRDWAMLKDHILIKGLAVERTLRSHSRKDAPREYNPVRRRFTKIVTR